MKKARIYISLPITGYDLEERKAYAAKAAEQARQQLLVSDTELNEVESITPFEVCTEANRSYGEYLGRDIAAILECTHVALCKGWERSHGCRVERVVASEYGIPVFKVKEPEQ